VTTAVSCSRTGWIVAGNEVVHDEEESSQMPLSVHACVSESLLSEHASVDAVAKHVDAPSPEAIRASDYPSDTSRAFSTLDACEFLDSVVQGAALRYALTGELPTISSGIAAARAKADLAALVGAEADKEAKSNLESWSWVFRAVSQAIRDTLSPEQLAEFQRNFERQPHVTEWLTEERRRSGIPTPSTTKRRARSL
jgi:hypothetical protein